MIEITAYKHEPSGEVFFSQDEYRKFEYKYNKEREKREKREAFENNVATMLKELPGQIKALKEQEKKRSAEKEEFAKSENNDLICQIDQYKLDIKKLQTALKICQESLKNHLTESRGKFDKKNPTQIAQIRALTSKLDQAKNADYSIKQARALEVAQWKLLKSK